MANIKIVTMGVFTKILVDDVEIQGVRKIRFSQGPGEVPILKLDLVADKMTIDSPALLALPEVYQGSYEYKKTAVPASTETAKNVVKPLESSKFIDEIADAIGSAVTSRGIHEEG